MFALSRLECEIGQRIKETVARLTEAKYFVRKTLVKKLWKPLLLRARCPRWEGGDGGSLCERRRSFFRRRAE